MTKIEEKIRALEEEFGGKWELDKNVPQRPRRGKLLLPKEEGVVYPYEQLMHWRNQGIEAQSGNAYEEDGNTYVVGMIGIYRKVE